MNDTSARRTAAIVSIYNLGNEISGGDKILLSLVRYLLKSYRVTVYGSPEVETFLADAGLASEVIMVEVGSRFDTDSEVGVVGLARHSMNRLRQFKQIVAGLKSSDAPDIIYSASDFPPDFLGGIALKKRYPSARLLAGYYLFAPNPLRADSPYQGGRSIRGIVYWLMQQVTIRMARRPVDILCVTSPDEKLTALRRWRDAPDRIGVVYGGVPVEQIDAYRASVIQPPAEAYDAVFVGRLHVQKGVLALIAIWAKVVAKRPDAQLALVGDGPLREDAKARAVELGISGNIDFLGYVDGEKKWDLYRGAKLVVHPATYDSGGMAAAEGLAFGLPGISFDLPSLREYYPKGMLKVPRGSADKFAEAVLSLLEDQKLYEQYAGDAFDLAHTDWTWDRRFDDLSRQIGAAPGLVFELEGQKR